MRRYGDGVRPGPWGGGDVYLTVPMKRTGSWGMMASWPRSSSSPRSAMLTPSTVMEPPASSTSLNRATPREDLPVDARPHGVSLAAKQS